MSKTLKAILATIISAIFLLSFVYSPTIEYLKFLANGGDEGVVAAPTEHVCIWECPECGLCLDLDCQEEVCLEKCAGHEIPHECETICSGCGKCLDMECTHSACVEKCGIGENYKTIKFEAEDPRVVRTKGSRMVPSVNPNGYLGNLGNNVGASIGYTIYAPTQTMATIYVSMSLRAPALRFDEDLELKVNGVVLETPAVLPTSPSGGSEWENFVATALGCAQLNQGLNEILITVKTAYPAARNFDKIVIMSTEYVSWPLHDEAACQSPCPHCGKCLNVDCRQEICAEKCAGHDFCCETPCSICGKCLDMECPKAKCAEKCAGHAFSDATTEYIFEAENSNPEGWSPKTVVKTGKAGASGESYVGGVGALEGDWYFTFEIYAEEAGLATLNYCFGGSRKWVITKDEGATTINDVAIHSMTETKNSGWENYVKYQVATVQLQKGKNVIKIYTGIDAYINFDYISLISEVKLSETPFA